MTTTTTAGTHRWATNRRPATLPPVPTNERLSFAVDQFTGSGQSIRSHMVMRKETSYSMSRSFAATGQQLHRQLAEIGSAARIGDI
jgi:hypothetical protein